MKKTPAQKTAVVIKYLPNYKMKYCFFNLAEREDEGGGWYSIKGYSLQCSVSKIYNDEFKEINIGDLTPEQKDLFIKEKDRYEISDAHKHRMKSYSETLKNFEKVL